MERPISWWVWKFGGSSLATYDRFTKVTYLIREQLNAWFEGDGSSPHTPARNPRAVQPTASSPGCREIADNHLAVVVSAIGGVTNLLAKALRKCTMQIENQVITTPPPVSDRRHEFIQSLDDLYLTKLYPSSCRQFVQKLYSTQNSHIYGPDLLKIVEIHMDILEQIRADGISTSASISDNPPQNQIERLQSFETNFFGSLNDIICILECVCLTKSFCLDQEALVLGQGEIWSVELLQLAISSLLKQIGGTNIIPVLLNARDCLIIRQIGKKLDVRQNLQKVRATTHSSLPNFNLTDKQPSFLPPLSRSCLASSNAPLCDYRMRREASQNNMDSIDYQIGTGLRETTPADKKPDDLGKPEVVRDWGFPPFKSFPVDFFPPAGPVVIQSLLPKGYIPRIDWAASYKALGSWFAATTSEVQIRKPCQQNSFLLLITGFICKTIDGRPATLQRNGSDTSAVAFATLLRAEGVTIWSDVAGIYTGDPRFCKGAEPLLCLNYDEALELAGIGAKVLHPGSLLPCMHMRLPMLLKSSYQPNLRGTTIA